MYLKRQSSHFLGSFEKRNEFSLLKGCLMKKGNLSRAVAIANQSVAFIKMKAAKESLTFLARSIRKIKPLICEKKSFNRKAWRFAPMPRERGRRLALRAIIQGARKRLERGMAPCIYLELILARDKQGYVPL